MLKSERDVLLKLCRQRERVAKSEVGAVAARRKADFERQLVALYSFDQSAVWKRAYATAQAAYRTANEEIAREAEAMGIPREFAPWLSQSYWIERGQNAVRDRRVELTKVAYRRIEDAQKQANLKIERSSLELQTQLLADCLESAEAKAFLEAMPSPEQLMPSITIDEVQRALASGNRVPNSDGRVQ